MRKFNFRLEKIKRYKEQLEHDKKMKMAAEQARVLREKDRLAEIMATRSRYYSGYGVRRTGKVDINRLIITKRYLDKLSRDINIQNETVKKAEKVLVKAQAQLIEASRERKKYEKLKEKYLFNYFKEVSRQESKELDEFGARGLRLGRSFSY